MDKTPEENPLHPCETGGRCFLCLIKLETEFEAESPSSNNSIQDLVQYLKIDLGKLLDGDRGLGLGMDVVLCEECATINTDFSELHRQLNGEKSEELDLEIGYCLKLIHGRLSNAEKDGRSEALEHQFGFRFGMASLRNKMIKSCALTLRNVLADIERINENEEEELDYSVGGPSDTKIKMEPLEMNLTSEDCKDGNHPERANVDSLSDRDWKPSPEMDSTTDTSDQEDEERFTTNEDDNEVEDLLDVNSTTKSLVVDQPTKPPNNAGNPRSIQNPDTGNYKCSNCGEEFKTSQGFNNHFESVHLKVKHKCTLCGDEFRQRASYLRHHKSVHMGSGFKCTICQKVFTQKWFCVQHFKSDHLGSRHQCTFCSETFAHSNSLNRHMRTRCALKRKENSLKGKHKKSASSDIERVLKVERIYCEFCNKPFSSTKTKNYHKKRNCPMRPDPLSSSDGMSTSWNKCESDTDDCHNTSLVIKTENEELPATYILPHDDASPNEELIPEVPLTPETTLYECSICNEKFSTSAKRRSHQIEQHRGRRYQCNYCTQTFMQTSSKNRHQRSCCSKPQTVDTQTPDQIGQVPKENETTTSTDDLAGPSELIDNLAEIQDPQVQPSLKPSQSQVAIVENKSHEDVPQPEICYNPETGKYKCNICSKEFPRNRTFQTHYRRVHMKTKVFRCTLCGKEYSRREHFDRHHRTVHSGVKFQCQKCGKMIADKSNFNKHEKICVGKEKEVMFYVKT